MDKASFTTLFSEETKNLPSPREERAGENFGIKYADVFFDYYTLLVKSNENINLTAITEPREVIRKHFLDSLLPYYLNLIPDGTEIADVGSGAGFPGIPLAILLPECRFTLLEPIGKRVDFLKQVIYTTGLNNCTAVKIRAEDAGACGREYRGSFDITLSRAVSRLSVLCEYCLPLLRTGGRMLALKSVSAEEEVNEAMPAIVMMGGGNQRIESCGFFLSESGERNVVVIEKTGQTPGKYPRRAGIPEKRPL